MGTVVLPNCIMVTWFQKSLIDSSSEEGQKPNEMNGMIELKNVVFRYPSRDEVPVIGVFFLIFSVFTLQ